MPCHEGAPKNSHYLGIGLAYLPTHFYESEELVQLLKIRRSWDGKKAQGLRLKTHKGAFPALRNSENWPMPEEIMDSEYVEIISWWNQAGTVTSLFPSTVPSLQTPEGRETGGLHRVSEHQIKPNLSSHIHSKVLEWGQRPAGTCHLLSVWSSCERAVSLQANTGLS